MSSASISKFRWACIHNMFSHACVYLLASGDCVSVLPPAFHFYSGKFLILFDLIWSKWWMAYSNRLPSCLFCCAFRCFIFWYVSSGLAFDTAVCSPDWSPNDTVHYPRRSACCAPCGPTSEGWGIPGLAVGSCSGNSSYRSKNLRTDCPSEFGAPPSRAFNIEGKHFTGRE
jgi:hypothetical protein